MKDWKNQIIDSIGTLQGKYSPYVIFTDWVQMSAISIQNSCCNTKSDIAKAREERYMLLAKKYSSDELKIISNMTGMLALELEERPKDVLGDIFMSSGCGNARTGQFFTPYHLSYLTAKISYDERFKDIPAHEKIIINEPSCGGGGMMIAITQVMKEEGIDIYNRVEIVAQDLDWNAVCMTYVQLALLGIKATVMQGNTLEEPQYSEMNILRTPAKLGAII